MLDAEPLPAQEPPACDKRAGQRPCCVHAIGPGWQATPASVFTPLFCCYCQKLLAHILAAAGRDQVIAERTRHGPGVLIDRASSSKLAVPPQALRRKGGRG